MQAQEKTDTRRDFLKKAAYAAPVILTLKAVPAFAQNGSGPDAGPCPEQFGDC